ncbi:MAG: 5'-nucleotidase C-terminal domain-containing protein [Oscillibacter sp.]|nr:5'-nucleotidase C-terminal domain-containing protein [Oscillibacter sp.]
MKRKKLSALLLALVMAVSLAVPALAADETQTVTILQTSDLHGMVNPYDYASNKESKTSMAHAAAIIAAERKTDPNLLLIDTGDATQANYIQEFKDQVPDPMIDAMNYLDYDAWTLGNHEFNFGFNYVEKEIKEFKGTTLAGNIYQKDGSRWLNAYQIFDVNGVKVAVFGIDAPHIPIWEKSDPTHYNNMTFTTPMEETGKILKELDGKADVVIGSVHYGLDGEYDTQGMREVAQTYGDQIDALFIGHAHSKVDETIGGVPVLEPGSNGQYVSKVTLSLTKKNGSWDVTKTDAGLIDCSTVTPDAAFLAKFKSLDEKSKALAAKQVGQVGETFLDPVELLPGIPNAILQDNPVLDLINQVQMKKVGADVSLAALFDASSNLEKGPFLNRDSVKIYKYDNTLYGVKVTGKQLKAIMEQQAGSFFNQYKTGDVTISFNPDIRMYNYDEFAGVNYEINISKPVGSRIQNVTYQGKPLSDTQTLVLALNNYRYGGLVTAGLLKESDVVYEGGAIRDMITDYVAALKTPLMPKCDNNWKIVGANLNDPQKDLIYEKVRSGELTVPTSEDGRTPNIASLNGPALRAAGKLPALTDKDASTSTTPATPVTVPATTPAATPAATAGGTYTVKSGDCLWSISQQFYGTGTKWTVIYKANTAIIKNADDIQSGQVLTIPAA